MPVCRLYAPIKKEEIKEGMQSPGKKGVGGGGRQPRKEVGSGNYWGVKVLVPVAPLALVTVTV